MNSFVFFRSAVVSISLSIMTACVPIQPYGSSYGDGKDTDDPNRANANKVLYALNAYLSEQGKLPKSLEYMVPDYIDNIPNYPQIRVNKMEKAVYYDQSSGWYSAVVCSAKIGSEQWRCYTQNY